MESNQWKFEWNRPSTSNKEVGVVLKCSNNYLCTVFEFSCGQLSIRFEHQIFLFFLFLGDMPYNGISPIEFVRILFFSLLLLLLLFLLSVWILGPWYLKNRINNHVQIFTVSMSSIGIALITSFYVITQPWRQLGAILCFHVIINIFITIHHKLTKFNTHKLQVIF